MKSDKYGRALSDEDVREVARMQRLIDDYEACLDYLYCLIYKEGEDPVMVCHDEDIFWFRPIERFASFVRHSHPELLDELRHKERQELRQTIQQRQERKAKLPMPFLKRSFSELWHRLSNHQDGEQER